MKPYYETDRGRLFMGDCLEVMKTLDSNSLDGMITDPPYGLSFMGKKWDYDVPSVEIWRECLRILKPGAHALIFAGSRTQHRMAVNVEDAGFVLKDCLEYLHELRWSDFYKTLDREQRKMFLNLSDESKLFWLYGSGFPKSLDISKQIDKAAGREREVMSPNPHSCEGRKPGVFHIAGGNKRPVMESKMAQLGIDKPPITAPATPEAELWNGWKTHLKPAYEPIILAMKPNDGSYAANALKHGVAGLNIDGGRIGVDPNDKNIRPNAHKVQHKDKSLFTADCNRPSTLEHKGRYPANVILDEEAARMLDKQSGVLTSGTLRPHVQKNTKSYSGGMPEISTFNRDGDSGGASRFFYTAKASAAEREKFNTHPTVKPLKLVQYLGNLLKTPTGGAFIDPFGGSGTMALAWHSIGCSWILCETEEESCEIAAKRIEAATSQKTFEDYL